MGSRYQVQMEYPFPPNDTAMLCKAWNDAVDQIDEDDDDMSDVIDTCLNNSRALISDQLDNVLLITDQIWFDDSYAELISKSWKAIMELSNLIRCCSAHIKVDGEMHGVKTLMDQMAECTHVQTP